MRSFIGLGWAPGSALVGCILGMLITVAIALVRGSPDWARREGFLLIALGLIGALAGLVVGLVMYARSAPAGEFLRHLGGGSLGLGSLVAVVGVRASRYL